MAPWGCIGNPFDCTGCANWGWITVAEEVRGTEVATCWVVAVVVAAAGTVETMGIWTTF